MAKKNTESVIEKEEKSTELRFNPDSKYMVSAVNPEDNKDGFHHCVVSFKECSVPLNKPVSLSESLFSYFTNAEILTVPGSNLKDESTYVDIEKETFFTERKKRFTVTEV